MNHNFSCLLLTLFSSFSLLAHDTSLQLLGPREGDPSSIVANVSTIQGDYTEVEVDLTVSAPDSLALSRFYSSGDTFDIAQFGGWRFHPHCYLSIQKDPKGKGYVAGDKRFERTLAYTGNPEGSILTYVGWYCTNDLSEKVLFKIGAEEEYTGICNTAKGSISSWTNHKNNELFFDPATDSFELQLCTKGKRFYQKSPSQDLYLLSHEILPSGNKLFYEFDDKGQLTSIRETNSAEEKTLAWIRIQYGDSIHVKTSDGQVAKYLFEPISSNARILTRVERSYKPSIEYKYKLIDGHALLVKKTLPEGRIIEIDYHSNPSPSSKVRSITIPLNETESSQWKFSYGDFFTEVEAPGGRKSIYRFDAEFQLTHIEDYLEGSLYRVFKKNWGIRSNSGSLISTSLEDSNGDIYHYKHFVYNTKGNIVEEREYGDIIGRGHVPLIIEDGHATNQRGHIKKISYFSGENTEGSFQTDASGSGVKCWYKKGTNLLLKKLFVTEGASDTEDDDSGIYKRHIYEYDENATLIKVTIDDGGVKGNWNGEFIPVPTEGRITKIFPKQNLPNLGAPEIVEERYFELENDPVEGFRKSKSKKEVLFKKTVNHFDSFGNIVSQDLFDANENTVVENYRFSAYGEEEIIDSRGSKISDSSIGNPWRYRGKRIDKELELIYFGYRYYDPQLGRWITPDPLGSIDGPNLYAYAQNNPIKYTDFFGLNSMTIDEDCDCTQHNHPGWHNAPEGCICICGKDGRIYFGRTGSTIKSSLSGISHGVVDFVVGSLHDLQTAALHMGSDDIEMPFDERMQMLEAIEISQISQMNKVESWMMDTLSIDSSDSVYHSVRSKTTLGLEVGSLVVGGYGAIKGVIGFNRLSRMPMQVSRITKSVKSSSLLKNKKIIQQIESFLGKDSRAFRNNYGDLLIESKDGLRQFRMDFKHPAPHKNPHSHLIEYEMRKNKKFEIFNQRIYPIDVIPE